MRLVFVSSTFKDMQFERDNLKSKVAPRLDAFLSTYGEKIHFGDLRWGVNTSELDEEESNKKVLKVCLDEIDNCKPYMIVFIGERYGWIPPSELMDETIKGKDIKDVSIDISVTNLEIEYGAFLNPNNEGRILFYFRKPIDTSKMSEEDKKIYESESPLHKKKLEELKARIKKTFPKFYREYEVQYDEKRGLLTGFDPLMEQIYQDLERILEIDYEEENKLSDFEKTYKNAVNHFEKYYEHAYINSDYFELNKVKEISEETYYFHSRFKNYPLLEVIAGEEGSGRKTRLASKYFLACSKDKNSKNHFHIPYVCNLDELTSGEDAFAKYMFGFLNINNEDEEFSYDSLFDLIYDLDKTYFTFYIMGCDKATLDFLKMIEANVPELKNIFFVITTCDINDNPYFYPFPFAYHNKIDEIQPLNQKDSREIINSVLKTKHKELSEEVISKILSKKNSSNPLYLSLIVERLTMLNHDDFEKIRKSGDGMVAINKYMINIIDYLGNDLKSLAKDILKELIENINRDMLIHIISTMTSSFHINVHAIEELFNRYHWPFNNIDLSLFIYSVPSLFTIRSRNKEYVEFASNEFVEAAKELLKEYKVDDFKEVLKEALLEKLEIENESYNYKTLSFIYEEQKDAVSLANLLIKLFNKESEEVLDEETGGYKLFFIEATSAVFSSLVKFIKEKDGLALALKFHSRLIEAAIGRKYQNVLSLYFLTFLKQLKPEIFEDKDRFNRHIFEVVLNISKLLENSNETEEAILYKIVAVLQSKIIEPYKYIPLLSNYYDEKDFNTVRDLITSDEADEALISMVEAEIVNPIEEAKDHQLNCVYNYLQNDEIDDSLFDLFKKLVDSLEVPSQIYDLAFKYDLDNSIDGFEETSYFVTLIILLQTVCLLKKEDIDRCNEFFAVAINSFAFTIQYDEDISTSVNIINYCVRLMINIFDKLEEKSNQVNKLFNAMYYITLDAFKKRIKQSEIFLDELEIVSTLICHYDGDEAHISRTSLIEEDFIYYIDVFFDYYRKKNESSEEMDKTIDSLIRFYYIFSEDELDEKMFLFLYLYGVALLDENKEIGEVIDLISFKIAAAYMISGREFDEYSFDVYENILYKLSDEDNDYTSNKEEFLDSINYYIDYLSNI